jgi:protein MpaA
VLGRSWQGRTIEAVESGSPAGERVLVFGVVHGDETAGLAVARTLAREDPHDLDLWIVPDLNPDGVAARTRGNARGVDLNRNFPWRWQPRQGVYASGPKPLSEREARIAQRLVTRLHPKVTIWFHQHRDLVWAAGGNRTVERAFSRVSGLPFRELAPIGGSATGWQNHALPDTTAFVAELPPGAPSPAAVRRYARAVLAAARAAQPG